MIIPLSTGGVGILAWRFVIVNCILGQMKCNRHTAQFSAVQDARFLDKPFRVVNGDQFALIFYSRYFSGGAAMVFARMTQCCDSLTFMYEGMFSSVEKIIIIVT